MNRDRSTLRLSSSAAAAWMLASMCWWIAGCGSSRDTVKTTGPGPRAEPVAPLRVAAASDLQAAFPRIAERFRASLRRLLDATTAAANSPKGA